MDDDKRMTIQKAAHRPEWYDEFLEALRDEPNVSRAARKVGISRQHTYLQRESDPELAKAWDDAIDEGIDRLEEEMHRRAYRGVDKPITYQGEVTDTYKEYSDTLAIFLAKAHRPEKYREVSTVKQEGELMIRIVREG